MIKKYLRKVLLASDVYSVCFQHALTTEKEEVMGLLIGDVDENKCISHISACIILHRSDKQPDRVEISPEQLYTASTYAEELARKLNRPMRVLGWYHSHPHITVWPSHVDVRTQAMYQTMDPLFVGLIFSVYQNDTGVRGNNVQVTCFQALQIGSEYQRREIELVIEQSNIKSSSLESIISLPQILSQEEVERGAGGDNRYNDPISALHNEAFQTMALVHIVSKVARPQCENIQSELQSTNALALESENYKKKLQHELATCYPNKK